MSATERLKLVGGGAGRLSDSESTSLREWLPTWVWFSTPLFRICVVHLLHLFRDVRMILCYVLNHQADHFIPRFRRKLLITSAAEILACHGFHGCLSS